MKKCGDNGTLAVRSPFNGIRAHAYAEHAGPAACTSPTLRTERKASMKKRLAAMALALCLALSTLTAASAVSRFPQYTGGSSSIAAALAALGVDSSYSNRSKIAAANGISGYQGTAAQNTRMLELLKQGALINPSASATAENPYFPAYTGSSVSIAAALAAVGADSSFSYRAQIAAANGIADYSGTAAQNTSLLHLLKQGRLIMPVSSAVPASSSGLTAANLGRVSFIHQKQNTCKATAAAMAVNVILGYDRYVTEDMIYSGVLCRSLDGELYTGSDQKTYRTTYQTDSYVGSLSELKSAVDAALSRGLPIVVAVHSSATRHHWIVIVGRDSGGGYLAVDPAGNGTGAMASQAKSMTSMGYSFGLTDYASPHYGCISFQPY